MGTAITKVSALPSPRGRYAAINFLMFPHLTGWVTLTLGMLRTVSPLPHVGDIAQWDPNRNGASAFGHVAYVAEVNVDGTIQVAEYNWLDSYDNYTGHRYNTRRISVADPSRYLRF